MITKKQRAQEILKRLKRTYTEAGEFVRWQTPLQLVVGTVLSAQCTDKKVNEVTRTLFRKYRTAADYAAAHLRTLEKEIYSTGFYRSKARYLKGIGQRLVAVYGGGVPRKLEDLLTLPGVSFKSGHLIMAKAFGEHTGIAVDTHVSRIAPRLGLSKQKYPEKIGADLESLYMPQQYLKVNEYFIMHGRATCKARPLCGTCVLQDICPSAKKFLRKNQK